MNTLLSKLLRHPAILPVYPAILLLLLHRDVFIDFDSTFMWDSIFWYGDFNYFVLSLAQGNLPLWDPFGFSGAPFYLNNNIVGTMDPTVLLTVPFARYGNVSVLDIYHIHYLARFFIFYIGAYALFRHITRNDWAAIFNAGIVLFVLAPNAFRQHGAIVMTSYVPLIVLFLLQLISPETSKNKKGMLFLSACYLTGITFNFYIPSYLFVYLLLGALFLLLTRTLKFKQIWQTIVDLGAMKIALGVILFSVMAGPFIYSALVLMPPQGEYFGLAREEGNPKSDALIHTAKLNLIKSQSTVHSSIHNIIAILLPGPDTRYYNTERFDDYMEHFITFGFVPLILIVLFYKRAESPYKGLFAFLTIIIGIYAFGPPELFYKLLQHFPGARTIRQLHNFLAFFMLTLGALSAICTAAALRLISPGNKISDRPSLSGLIGLGAAHIAFIYIYLNQLHKYVLANKVGRPFLMDIEQNITAHGWTLLTAYLLTGLFLCAPRPLHRILLVMGMVGLTAYQLITFNIQLRPFVLQPAHTVRDSHVHYNREFEYQQVRVPYTPRLGDFKGFLPALYRIPSAVPEYFNTYMVLGRRVYDYIRFVPAERQRIISGIGAKRFGFFDKYIIAKDSVEALNMIRDMPKASLNNTLVLEENPIEIVPESRSLEKVDARSRIHPENNMSALTRDNLPGRHQRMIDFYDRAEKIDYPDTINNKLGLQTLHINPNSPALDWPWEKEYIGFFQVMIGEVQSLHNYDLFDFFPNPSLQTKAQNQQICYNDYTEWFVKHSQPGFYKTIYDRPIEPCDLSLNDNKLIVSNELRGAFISNAGDKKGIIEGFTIASLDPKLVTPERSPYGRDESVEITDFGPNTVQFKIDNKKAGFFYYADSFDSHWQATVDGSPAHLFHAQFNFKAVFVPEGKHLVTMQFRPWGYIIAMTLFFIISLTCMVLPIIALWRGSHQIQAIHSSSWQ